MLLIETDMRIVTCSVNLQYRSQTFEPMFSITGAKLSSHIGSNVCDRIVIDLHVIYTCKSIESYAMCLSCSPRVSVTACRAHSLSRSLRVQSRVRCGLPLRVCVGVGARACLCTCRLWAVWRPAAPLRSTCHVPRAGEMEGGRRRPSRAVSLSPGMRRIGPHMHEPAPQQQTACHMTQS